MTTKTVETSTDNPESALNNLEALVCMVFDHVGQHIHESTGDLQAMHVYQCMLMAIEQVETLKRDAYERDMQFAREHAASRVVKLA